MEVKFVISKRQDFSEGVAFDYLETPLGLMEICSFENAISSLDFISGPRFKENHTDLHKVARKQISQYFKGNLREFDLPIMLNGSEFQLAVWKQMLSIPYGNTVSYQEIANAIGKPKSARAVGGASGRNPISIIVPCHRVIGTNGKLTGYGGGIWRKERLLALEGRYLINS
jgi:methylated-DNA-[protein]-cysteine S-methyltransferase